MHPQPQPERRSGPLSGLKVLEFNAIGPVPFAGGLLSDLGADVLRIEAPGPQLAVADEKRALHLRGRSAVTIDLRDPVGRDTALRLADAADVLIEGYRPGVMEKLGLDPDELLGRNPGLIVGRMTGWGQTGPLAQQAGHDIDYIAAAGALRSFARAGQPPVPPVNLVGDFGGGAMFLVTGILAALFERSRSGRGQIVDAAMVDGAAYLMMLVYSLAAQGMWDVGTPGGNLLDTGAPFYDVYECADGGYVAVGCLEPKFYEQFMAGIGLTGDDVPPQSDVAGWPRLRELIAASLRQRTRAEWEAHFEGTDACVASVRSMTEAAEHPHLKARGTFLPEEPLQPGPAPRFSRTPGEAVPRSQMPHGAQALAAWGIEPEPAERIARTPVEEQ